MLFALGFLLVLLVARLNDPVSNGRMANAAHCGPISEFRK
jgi:hypothetical protein